MVAALAKLLIAATLTGTVAQPSVADVNEPGVVLEFEDCLQDAIILSEGDKSRIMCSQAFVIRELKKQHTQIPCPKCPPPPEPVNELTVGEIIGVGSAGAVVGAIITWLAVSLASR